MNNAFFGKNMKNVRKHVNIKLITTERRENNLVSESNYRTTKFSQKIYQQQKETKTEILMNNPLYLGFLMLELSKILMHEFWYEYVKQKYCE